MNRLIILPGVCDTLGGTVITLSLLIKGFEQSNVSDLLCVLVRSGSMMEKYLHQAGQKYLIKSIPAKHQVEFAQKALQWVNQQPKDNPLLLDNWVHRLLQLVLLSATPKLRLSSRKIYHFFHDLALSYNHMGYLLRKLTFTCLAPEGICNSYFTAKHIRQFSHRICGVMYQPVDVNLFQQQPLSPPPFELQTIIESGAKIILTPSRINQPRGVNDKNLRALIPVLAHLKANGYHFHTVVIGQDLSPGKIYTQELIDAAKNAGVADCFTVLPPTFAIQDYYNHADIVLTLAPREPFGRIVVEAIACNTPVIGSATGGIGEILSQFAPQWMVDANDYETVAETIIRVCEDSTTARTLAKAKSWVTQHCSLTVYAQKMMEITGCIQSQNVKKRRGEAQDEVMR